MGLRNEGGATALHFAAFTGQLGVLRRLLPLPGVALDDMTFTGGTPLRAAAAQGHLEVVEQLLALGADPAPVDDFERRPVDDARDAGHASVVASSRRPRRWRCPARVHDHSEASAPRGVLPPALLE